MEAVDATRLREFFVAAEEGQVGRAAARVGIAQPSLSQQIRRLEHEIGTPLFRGHPKGVDLTEAGAALEREAPPAYAALVAAVRGARAVRQRRVVRVGVPLGGFAQHPSVVAVADAATPVFGGAELEYVAALTAEAVRLVRDGRVDIAFVYGPLEDTEVDAVPAFVDVPVVVLPAGHVLAEQAELTIEAPRAVPDPVVGAGCAAGYPRCPGVGVPAGRLRAAPDRCPGRSRGDGEDARRWRWRLGDLGVRRQGVNRPQRGVAPPAPAPRDPQRADDLVAPRAADARRPGACRGA